MIPSKIRRTIIVDGVDYEYCVTGCVTVFIKNLLTKETYSWWQEWKEKWKQKIMPSNIRELIKTGSLFGTESRRNV